VWTVTPGQTSHQQLIGHSYRVNCVKFSPDGFRLASTSFDNTLSIWNPETGDKLTKLLGHIIEVMGVAFSPDGDILASGSRDRTIRLWHSSTGKAVREPLTKVSTGGIDLSPDGEIIAGTTRNGVELLKCKTGEKIVSLKQNTAIYCVQFLPDGRSLVTVGGQTVRLWNLQPDLQNTSWVDLGGHGGDVNWATFSPDGLNVASASDDGTIRIWSAGRSQLTVQPLPAHNSAVCSLAVSHDGTLIVSGSNDNSVQVWCAGTGESTLLPLCGHRGSASSVSISPDGRLIVSAQARVQARAQARARAHVWARERGRMQEQASAQEMTWEKEQEQDWRSLRGEEVRQTLELAREVTWELEWVMRRTREQEQAQEQEQELTDYTLRLRDAQSGAVAGEPMHGHTGSVMAVTFSNSGRRLASASGDRTARIWDVATQQALAVGPLNCIGLAYSVAFSPDDELVAAGDDSGRVYLWRTDTGEPAHKPLHADDEIVWSLAFSPDGAQIVVGGNDNAARIWDIAAGQYLFVLQGHTSSIFSVAWSIDGCVIATGSEDTTLRLWNAITGAPLATLHGHTKAVLSVAFTRDGRFIISGSEDAAIRKWDIRVACQLASANGNDPSRALAPATLKDGWMSVGGRTLDSSRHATACRAALTLKKSCGVLLASYIKSSCLSGHNCAPTEQGDILDARTGRRHTGIGAAARA